MGNKITMIHKDDIHALYDIQEKLGRFVIVLIVFGIVNVSLASPSWFIFLVILNLW